MDLDATLREIGDAVTAAQGARGRDARWLPARQVLVRRCMDVLKSGQPGPPSLSAVIRLAADAPVRPARRACAVLLVHALAMRGLVPQACAGDVCALAEAGLRDVLLRCGYPFGGSLDDRMRVLERLHATIGDLMQPLEPTFPNWQGLYAG